MAYILPSHDDDAAMLSLAFRLDVDQNLRAVHLGPDRLLQSIANTMRLRNTHGSRHDQMKLDERGLARTARAQIVRLDGADGVVGDDVADAARHVRRHRLVH